MLVITEKRLVVKNINDQNYFTLSNSAMCAKLWSSGVKQVRWVDILVKFKGPRLSFFIKYCGVKTVDNRKFLFKMAQLNFAEFCIVQNPENLLFNICFMAYGQWIVFFFMSGVEIIQ